MKKRLYPKMTGPYGLIALSDAVDKLCKTFDSMESDAIDLDEVVGALREWQQIESWEFANDPLGFANYTVKNLRKQLAAFDTQIAKCKKERQIIRKKLDKYPARFMKKMFNE